MMSSKSGQIYNVSWSCVVFAWIVNGLRAWSTLESIVRGEVVG